MSDGTDRDEVLQSERAVNERYRTRTMRDLDETRTIVGRETALPANTYWSTGGARVTAPRGTLHPIVGRVAFDPSEDCPVEGDLYIGPWFQELEGFTVVNWSAPVASLFFRGRDSADEAAGSVAGVRTFLTKQDDIVDYEDRVEDGSDSSPFAGSRSTTLDVPLPPSRTAVPRPTPTPITEEQTDVDSVVRDDGDVDDDASLEPALDDVNVDASSDVRDTDSRVEGKRAGTSREAGGIRVEGLVRKMVEQPRTGQLTSVLSTLQPDQYELVTWRDDKTLIVSGPPGTGKTVIAMHRAGFLTHPERPGGPLSRVLVVGPTDEYRDHVRTVSESVGGAAVPVISVNQLLGRLARVDPRQMGPGQYERFGVHKDLFTIVNNVKRGIPAKRTAGELFDAVLKELVTKGALHQRWVRDPDMSSWLVSIGSIQKAKSEQKFLPLLATVGVVVFGIPPTSRVEHMIVDEAQDVPLLVWTLLSQLLEDGGSFSIFGDVNQRRSDWTPISWLDLARFLAVCNDDGSAPTKELVTGYRTTRQILKFANQLLPKNQRVNNAIRDGDPPTITRTQRNRLYVEAVSVAISVSHRRGPGLTAIITVDPRRVKDDLRSNGWRSEVHRPNAMVKGDETIFVYHPDVARGIEFDSVIVVEPEDFPVNVGREGVLYTSLTRATKELFVIHSRSLPNKLRPVRR